MREVKRLPLQILTNICKNPVYTGFCAQWTTPVSPPTGISQIPQGIYIAANKNLPSVEGRFFRVSKNPQIVKTQKIHPIKSVGDGSPVPKVIFSKMPCYARRFDLLLGATLLSIRIHFGVALLVFGASLTSGSLSKT